MVTKFREPGGGGDLYRPNHFQTKGNNPLNIVRTDLKCTVLYNVHDAAHFN